MKETKQQLTARKIRNGLRKQAEKILAKKMKVWDVLKQDPQVIKTDDIITTTTHGGDITVSSSATFFYCPYIPIINREQ